MTANNRSPYNTENGKILRRGKCAKIKKGKKNGLQKCQIEDQTDLVIYSILIRNDYFDRESIFDFVIEKQIKILPKIYSDFKCAIYKAFLK